MFQDVSIEESEWERRLSQDLADYALAVSPEKRQIGFLIESAKSERWARIFGFLSGASLSQSADPGSNVKLSFSELSGAGFLNFGLSRFPMVSLATRNIESLKLRQVELEREFGRLGELSLGSPGYLGTVPNAFERLRLARAAETALDLNYQAVFFRFEAGDGATFQDVLNARLQIPRARTERLRAENDVNLGRIQLHRMAQTWAFAEIRGCERPKLGSKANRFDPVCEKETN